ncbi:protein kinase family protein [Actinosynnema pretiosum subsp. pretiosum]|uniref:Integral membrane protein MviN n=2 Tax=Actinosynnema TaxID=40566 RepID=C6WSK3_ACTMD|nr:protein kinase family protein [Actinosynnema mirum]ACU40873.1 hypothetical protein Amir_7083 [Actinosynnema mirum DSM 43827]QUF01921.1 protein kinase family protein [Actinosynnema pretiosum subsp. pretiosum]
MSGGQAHSTPLVPGGVIGDGRYRLLALCGRDNRCDAQLWHARDGQLGRDVALTVLVGVHTDHAAATRAKRTAERAMHASSFTHPGVARVMEVLTPGNGVKFTEGILAIIVADWTQGTDLVELLAGGALSAGATTTLVEHLAAAVEGAHHAGLVLGVDHPQRVRVTPEGRLRLAFPGPRPDAIARDDVRGLGALLYLLLTARWPLPGAPEGYRAAQTGQDGSPVAPSALNPLLPHELSSVAVRSLQDTPGGIRTSAAILQVLDQISRSEAQTAMIEPVGGGKDDGVVWTTQRPVAGREHNRKLMISVGVLALLTLVVIGWLGFQIVSFFSTDTSKGSGPTVVVGQSSQPGQPDAPVPAEPVQPAAVGVYDVTNKPDNPNRANRAVDNNPTTVWQTEEYAQPFPALKPGIGLMASFAEPLRMASVSVTSPSAGTVVEIRTAPSNDAPLEQTKVIAQATLSAGQTQLQLGEHEASQHLLVWVTKLAENDRGSQSEIAEVVYVRAQ